MTASQTILREFRGYIKSTHIIIILVIYIIYLKHTCVLEKNQQPVNVLRLSGSDANVKSIQNIKILCWIPTFPKNSKVLHVKETWGKHCDTFLVMSSANDTDPDTISLPNTKEGWELLWGKTKEAFKYIWKHHKGDADWFLKADDDTFVILANLRLMLHDYDTKDPVWFGSKLKYDNISSKGYMDGGPGYVLSQEAVRRFVELAIPDGKICEQGSRGYEDLELGKCLDNVGVRPVDTRDKMGRHRFLALNPGTYANMKSDDVYWQEWSRYYPQNKQMQLSLRVGELLGVSVDQSSTDFKELCKNASSPTICRVENAVQIDQFHSTTYQLPRCMSWNISSIIFDHMEFRLLLRETNLKTIYTETQWASDYSTFAIDIKLSFLTGDLDFRSDYEYISTYTIQKV